MNDALEALGVFDEALSDSAARDLDQRGYAFLPGIVSTRGLTAMKDRLRALHHIEGSAAGIEVGLEPGVDRLSDLLDPRIES